MKRIIMMVLRLFYIAPFWFYKLSYMGKHPEISEKERYKFLHNIIKKINKAGRVTIETKGVENLPEQDGYILFPNHQGMFDVLAILESSPRPFTVVLKQELKNIVLLKQLIRFLNALTLDRKNPRDAIRVINQMSEEVAAGRNYLIFAEGTRSKQGNQPGEFKGGSFKSAIQAKCPIVPVVLIDAFKPFDTGTVRKEKVQVHFIKPLYYEEYKDLKSRSIAEIVKLRIEETISNFQEKNV